MIDTDLDRPIPQNWRERLAYTKEMKAMLVWIWKDLINPAGKKLVKKILVYSFLASVCGLAVPWALGLTLTGVASGNDQKIITGFCLFCVVYLLQLKIANTQSKNRERLWGENTRCFDNYVLKSFFQKSLGQHLLHDDQLNESVLKKGDERIKNIENGLLLGGFDVIFGMLLSYTALWFLCPPLSLLFGLLATIMIIIHISWSLCLNQRVLMVTIPLEKKWRADSRYKFERINAIEKVKTSAKENDELEELDRRFAENLIPDLRFWLWFINQTGWRGLTARILLLGIMGLGLYGARLDLVSVGLLLPLMNWTMNLVQNLWQIGDLEYRINYATPPVLALKKALALSKGLKEDPNPVVLGGDDPCRVEFRNVGFSYPDNNQKVLQNISFIIEPGEKVALLGQSGVGKTTVMKLALCYSDPDSGVISVDGIDMTKLDRKSWLRGVGYISQNVVVWNGTIRDNLLYNLSPDQKIFWTDDKLWEVMNDLQINFGDRLDKGLDTVIGERGVKLSGGEAQRLSIGAAVIKNPRMLIIDEATSSLDASTEKLTWKGIEKILIGSRSALIITHRLNTVRNICDKFILLNSNGDGSYIEATANSFEELAEKSEVFRQIATDQGIML